MRKVLLFAALGSAAATVGWACVEQSAELSAADREALREFVSTTAPTPAHPLDVQLENKVKLLGYDLEPAEARPGQPVTITWYWKSERPLEEGWRMFTHVADAAGTNRLNQDGEGTVRRLYQPGRWKAGEYIKDVQRITIPADWNSPRATFFLGIYNGNHRLEVTRGPHDGENRIRALSIPVVGSTAPTPAPGQTGERPPADDVPSLRATKLAHTITHDGRLDEPGWVQAARSLRFVDTMSGGNAELEAYAYVTWDPQNLWVGFDVKDDFLKSTFRADDDHLWEQDAVEIMVDPEGDGRNYFEIQVAPTGRIFTTRYDSRRQPQPFGHLDWNATGIQARVNTRGTVNDDDEDQGYTVEIKIPFSAFAAGDPPATPPAPNSSWRMNFYVMDTREEGGQRAAGWSPPRVGDFHVPNRFGRIVFFDAGAAAAPPSAQGGEPTAQVPQIRLPPEMMKQLQQQIGQRRAVSNAERVNTPRQGEEVPAPPPR